VLILQPVCEPPDVVAARDLVALLNMLEREEFTVTMAHVAHSKVYAGAVGGGAQHQALHGLGDPDLLHVGHLCLSWLAVATTVIVAVVPLIVPVVCDGH
jgi:hypothetical protein